MRNGNGRRIARMGLLFTFLFVLLPFCMAVDAKVMLGLSFPRYTVLDYRSGNFTNSGKAEYVVFLESKGKDKDITVTLIDRVCVVIMGDNKIERTYDLEGLNGIADFNHFQLEAASNKNVNWGGWDGFCCVRDFNGNGLDEVLIFQLTGMSFLPYVFEYDGDQMKLILNPPPTYSDIVIRFEAVDSDPQKYIMIWGAGDKEATLAHNGKRDWYKYIWNEKIGKYQIVDRGVQ